MFITKKKFQEVISEAVAEERKRNQLRIENLLNSEKIADMKIKCLNERLIRYEQQLYRPRDQKGKFTHKM